MDRKVILLTGHYFKFSLDITFNVPKYSTKNLFLFIIKKIEAKCAMYGQCSPSGRGDNGHYYCRYDGEPIKQNSTEFLSLFKVVCPFLYNETETRTCCDLDQLKYMDSQLSVPKQLMSRCPACLANFKSFLCDMTCSGIQSEFIMIPDQSLKQAVSSPPKDTVEDEKETNEDSDYENEYTEKKETKSKKETYPNTLHDKQDVITYNYLITNTYVTQMFNSCK